MAYSITTNKWKEVVDFYNELFDRKNKLFFGFYLAGNWEKVLRRTQELATSKKTWDGYANFGYYLHDLGDTTKDYDDGEATKRIKAVREIFSEAVIDVYHAWAKSINPNKVLLRKIDDFVADYINYNSQTDEQAVLKGVEAKKKTDEITKWATSFAGLSDANQAWGNASKYFTDDLVTEWTGAGFSAAQAKEWMDAVGPGAQSLEVYNVDFYKWLRDIKKQPGTSTAVDVLWVLNFGNFDALQDEYDNFVASGGSASGSSGSGSWSGSGPRHTAISPKKVIAPTFVNGLGGKTAFDLTPMDDDQPIHATLKAWKDLGLVKDDNEKKAIEDWVKEKSAYITKLDPFAGGSWRWNSTKNKAEFVESSSNTWFTQDQLEWIKEEMKHDAKRKEWLDNQKNKATTLWGDTPYTDHSTNTIKVDGVNLKRNDGVGNISFVFPYKYDADPRRVANAEGSILTKDKKFGANPRIHNPFIE